MYFINATFVFLFHTNTQAPDEQIDDQMEIDETESEAMLIDENENPNISFASNLSEDFPEQNCIGFSREDTETAEAIVGAILKLAK